VHHSWLIECSKRLDLLSDRRMELLHVRPQGCHVERSRDPKGPGERSALVREIDTRLVGVHRGTSTGQVTVAVDGENTVDEHDTQQGGLHGANPAAHAGAHRTRDVGRR
jgi:hypothetical protein